MSTETTVSEASNLLKISQQRVRTLCRNGDLIGRKIGSTWLISVDSLESYGLKTAHMVAENHSAYNVKNSSKPILLSFFSGAMGLDLGLEKSGFEIRLACEVDKFCRQTIALNRPDIALVDDINKYSASRIRSEAGLAETQEIDLIAGGPPCQSFSTAGKRNGFNDLRGNVFLKYLDLCLELRPKFFVIENVRGLLSCPMTHRPHNQRGSGYPSLKEDELRGGALNFVVNRIKNSGYGYSFNLYNSANFGTPQIRERVIIICSRDGRTPDYLNPTHSDDEAYGLPKWRSFKDAVKGINEHTHIKFPERRLRYYQLLGPGQNWRNLPLELQKEAMGKSFFSGGGKTGFLRRLAWNRPSPTLVTHPAMPATDLAHPEEDRPLSIEEYKRLQQFPNNWKLAGPLIQQYKQIGNAVPVGLGYAVGCAIMRARDGDIAHYPDGFRFSRYKNSNEKDWTTAFEAQLDSRAVERRNKQFER
jgi:DNA (cytosine-5)-methyltransferase 1